MQAKIFSGIASILCFIFLGNCQPAERKESAEETKETITVEKVNAPLTLKHATAFQVAFHEGYKVVEVTRPWKGAKTTFRYLLVPHGAEAPAHEEHTTVIRTPVKRMVATSTTHLPAFDLLNASEVIKGFPNTDYISSEKMRRLIREGELQDLGPENNMNMELLLSLQPDLIMSYSMGANGADKFSRTGIPVVLNADYMETTPLGRAEWIKFTALFLDKEKEAEAVFNRIESRYDSLKQLAGKADKKPSVYSGIVYGDTWYMPGGESWAARFMEDANAHYLWEDTEEASSLPLSFEAVYAKAHEADYWLNVGSFESLKAIADHDSRYKNFKAFLSGQVYNNNAKLGEKGGYTYLELGCARPDMVLADLVKIFHPELMPDYSLYFYNKLD